MSLLAKLFQCQNRILFSQSGPSSLGIQRLSSTDSQPSWTKYLPSKKLRALVAKRNRPTLAVIPLQGIILAQQGSFGSRTKNINLANCRKYIDKAFSSKRLEAVVLNINSPGGSPVQSEIVAEYIMTRAKDKSVPVYSFVEDLAASGGYWIACAGQKIFLSSSSIVGSIGAVSASFGLHDAIGRLGIERRILTAGKNKFANDPFQPWLPKDKEITQNILNQIHANFISHVKNCRGSRLKGTDDELFNGDIWVGRNAIEMGLADEILSLDSFVWKEFGGPNRVKLVFYNQPTSPLQGLIGSQLESIVPSNQLLTLARNVSTDNMVLSDRISSSRFY